MMSSFVEGSSCVALPCNRHMSCHVVPCHAARGRRCYVDDTAQCCYVIRKYIYALQCRCCFVDACTLCYVCNPTGIAWGYTPHAVTNPHHLHVLNHFLVSVFRAWIVHARRAKEVGKHVVRMGDRRRLFFLHMRSTWGAGWEWARIAMDIQIQTACELPALFRGIRTLEVDRRSNERHGTDDVRHDFGLYNGFQ